ncbi:MAG: hypothetical protein N3F66_05975 [Spirochaetes bacterium]|nr:hypothetical protein [Spirochaetota bacterium]
MIRTTLKVLYSNIKNNYFDTDNNLVVRWQFVLALVGAALLTAGVFSPFIKAPFIGIIPYTRIGKYYDEIVIVFAIFAIIIALLGLYRLLLISAMGSLGVIVFSIYSVYNKVAKLRVKVEETLYANPYKDIMTSLLDSVQQSIVWQWGIILLITGIVLLIVGALIKPSSSIVTVKKKLKNTTHVNQASE